MHGRLFAGLQTLRRRVEGAVDTLARALGGRQFGLPRGFDVEWYLAVNPDVKASGVDPRRHYRDHGGCERRLYRLPQANRLPVEERRDIDRIRRGTGAGTFFRNHLPVSLKRIAILAHYDPDGVFDDYFIASLKRYCAYFDRILLVTSSVSSPSELSKVAPYVDDVCSRRNFAYDFMSWRVGYETLSLARIDSVTFINDSVFGPVGDFGPFIDRQRRAGADLFGASLSREIIPHVQTYYFCMNAGLLASKVASAFWSSVGDVDGKAALIRQYEVALSWRVQRAGLSLGAIADLGQPDDAMRRRALADNCLQDRTPDDAACANITHLPNPNPMQLFWGETLRQGCPFVKRQVLQSNPMGVSRRAVVSALADRGYDPALLSNYFRRVMSPADFEAYSHETSGL